MCGIAGFIQPGLDLQAVVSNMTDRLQHRGPDARGVWCDQQTGVALGHRRLSILDMSEVGSQPMHSASGCFVISYNGEIYNFRDLAKELGQLGCSFRGHSDTEVLLVAIEQWGIDGALFRINGMFALHSGTDPNADWCWRATGWARSCSTMAGATLAPRVRQW